ncbi:MAG: flavin reductase family protein [Oscillospiraceae bacterium]
MSKVTWKGGALIAPLPAVMVTCGTMEKSNALTIGWTGITNTVPPKTYISVRPERYSHDIIKQSMCFVINLTTSDMVKAVDYCGVRSGKNEDKLAKMNLSVEKANTIDCPMLEKSPVSIECKVTDIISMGSHDMFLADITAVNVDEKYIDKNGKLDLQRCSLLAYAHGEYFKLGEKIGSFGFSVKKPAKKRKKTK